MNAKKTTAIALVRCLKRRLLPGDFLEETRNALLLRLRENGGRIFVPEELLRLGFGHLSFGDGLRDALGED